MEHYIKLNVLKKAGKIIIHMPTVSLKIRKVND